MASIKSTYGAVNSVRRLKKGAAFNYRFDVVRR